MLRQQHDEARESVAKAITDRKAKGIPTDDLVDWRADVSTILGSVASAKDREDIVPLLERAHAIANGGMRALPQFVADPATDGVEVKFRAISKADVMEMRADIAAVPKGADTAALWRSGAETQRTFRPFLTKCLAAVRGVRLEDGTTFYNELGPTSPAMAEALDALDEAGLLPAVFACARAYQDLPSFLRAPFGLLHPSTSEPSGAVSVHKLDGAASDVTAAPLVSTSKESSGRPTGVPSGTSLTTMIEAGPYVQPSDSMGGRASAGWR